MADEIDKIWKLSKILIRSDKTNNVYMVSSKEYKKIVNNEVTKSYKKAPEFPRNCIIFVCSLLFFFFPPIFCCDDI